MTETPFAALLRAQSSPAARERWHQARSRLELNEHDAVWGLVQVMEEYYASLGPPRNATAPAATPLPPQWVFQSWQLVCAGLAIQTAAVSVAFFVGRNWNNALPPDAGWLRAMLTVPAGWVMFLLTLPFLLQGAVSSWQARKRDGFIGWVLVLAFAAAIVASATALWRLL